jgi:hypothetical protein
MFLELDYYNKPAIVQDISPPNLGPEGEECGACPINSFSTVKIGARLAEMDISQDEYFCRKSDPNLEADNPNFVGKKQATFKRIWARLYVMLKAFDKNRSFPPNDEECNLTYRPISILGSGGYVDLYVYSQRERPNILNRWKETIWETSPVVQTIKSQKEISDEEAISHVQELTEKIGNILNNCPKQP